MGVKLRAKVARSHTPTSVGTRGDTGSARTGHNEGQSELGNVFKRLGRGADLRDILNKRRDQDGLSIPLSSGGNKRLTLEGRGKSLL